MDPAPITFSDPMPTDLSSRADIDALMVRFYSQAMTDPVIGHFFTEVVKLDLEHHLPIIGDFWETVIFGSGNYARHGRHPLMVHAAISQKEQLEFRHFERWLEIFDGCVDAMFDGPRSNFIKQRAHAIAGRMSDYVTYGT